MAHAHLQVELLDVSKNALSLIYVACRQCYSTKFAGDMLKEGKGTVTHQEDFVRDVVASGHESPLEHVKFTFAVQGVSRALTHQLVRHRLASYSQQSQRYVKESDFDYIIPPAIEADDDMKKEYVNIMGEIQKSYNRLLRAFEKKGKKGESANQDARFVLPQAAETKIVVTMNCRELIHFFKERCCMRAQWEIRTLAEEMLSIAKKKLPGVFNGAGAKCVDLGYCPEGPKFTCKRYPLKKEVFGENLVQTLNREQQLSKTKKPINIQE
ncbi:MAG: FAD-dependent thymidylate synthase [Sphaerochaeta sp.]|jgi:thymidylate synthase (FAD)|nr:FAD-dependent thymidylate synthase [Sphaerochaeta sp.]